ncbi:hypothetical protein ABOM_007281 [Aspergillus bombycis]|uniref:MYND-type domain-containing protein n=1 Tax=Aspergillus bombycis TaxID=109264 RepID=A0A1F7ZYG6_9EURO|nr:hypothetical protein ABOM_007281 [Aspergillus bombycis]OGM44108.1 hypothetical protein ABOM_007281 [Aspergillus bombycis]
MENPSSTTGSCAHCQSPATKRCNGCTGAPEYDKDIPKPTFYCSSVCQTQDWGEHKTKCKPLQARKSLSRAANTLQAILYRIRLRAHTVRSATAVVDGSRVILRFTKEDKQDAYRHLRPLAVEVKGGDQRAFDAIVMISSCTEALLYLFVFVRDFLSGLCSKIEELTIDVHNPEISIETINGFPLTTTERHNVYRVTLTNGEIWVIDPSGAQYGFTECLYTWHDFAKRRLCRSHREDELGYQRVKASQGYVQCNEHYFLALEMELLELAPALDEKIPALTKVCGGNLKLILQGSHAAFQKAKNELLDQLDKCVDLCVDEIHSPEQMVKRSLLVNRCIASRMAGSGARQ